VNQSKERITTSVGFAATHNCSRILQRAFLRRFP
jgi:hypothetical protein